MKCECGGDLSELVELCAKCDGQGGFGDWIEFPENTCAACGGWGTTPEGEEGKLAHVCKQCGRIYWARIAGFDREKP